MTTESAIAIAGYLVVMGAPVVWMVLLYYKERGSGIGWDD